jgi:hypothetical protein
MAAAWADDVGQPLTATLISPTLRAMHHVVRTTATRSQQQPARARST